MKKDIQVYIEDILKAMEKIEVYVKDLSCEELEKDSKTFEAVIWNFTVLGEAAKGIPDDLRARYPDIPWREMAGMRDKLVHQYSQIDIRVVWEAVKKRFQMIKPQLKELLEKSD